MFEDDKHNPIALKFFEGEKAYFFNIHFKPITIWSLYAVQCKAGFISSMWTKVGCLWHAEMSSTCFPVQYPKAWNIDAKIKSNFLYVMEQTHLIYRMYSVENLSCLFSALRFTLSLMMPWFQSELFMADTSALHGCSSAQRCAHSVVCCRPNSAVTIISVIYF